MFLSDLIDQGRSVLPLFTDAFSNNVDITSINKSGDTVTVVSQSHGLVVGNKVVISQVKTLVPLISITFTGQIATATASIKHDLTKGFTLNAEIVSLESVFNGTFKITEVLGENVFKFEFTGTPGGASTGTLKTFHNIGFNGPRIVTNIVDSDTFEYEIPGADLISGTGDNMQFRNKIRISGAATIERAIETYTKQKRKDLWGFWVLDDAITSADRRIDNDSVGELQEGEDFKLRMIQDAHFYVFFNSKDQTNIPVPNPDRISSGRSETDLGQELAVYVNKTYSDYLPQNQFTTKQQTVLRPISFGVEDYLNEEFNLAVLVFRYSFQATFFLLRKGESEDLNQFMSNTGDTLPNLFTRAFTDFEWELENTFNEIVKDDEFKIPQEGC